MADEEFYLQVENELKAGTKDEALWSKAKVFAEEKNTSPQLEYTKMRLEQLKTEGRKTKVVTWVEIWWPKIKPWIIGYIIFCIIGLIIAAILGFISLFL
tara:strand:+ start:44 stop:340 length:297 start_codon:yes stop_codon:yes gene_type:complete